MKRTNVLKLPLSLLTIVAVGISWFGLAASFGQEPSLKPTPAKPTLANQSPANQSSTKQAPVRVQVPVDLTVRNQPLIMRTEAYAGLPYGIGKVKFRLRQGDEMIERIGATKLTDSENRVFYPVVTRSAARNFIQGILGGDGQGAPDDAQTFWFLFKGQAPLNLTLHGSDGAAFQVQIEVVKRQKQFDRLVKQWWQTFNRALETQIESSDYPPVVETYLQTLIGKRMGFQTAGKFKTKKDPLLQTFELMFDVESLRNDTIRSLMTNGVDVSVADQPLPAKVGWTPVVVENLPEDIEIEPIAKCVPQECFYLRFGTWENQLWLQKLTEEFGGDLGQMVQVRGFKYKIQSKFLNQLAIQSTEWDRLFGGSLIDDVAVIGFDTYFDDGSAVGVMLHAKSTKRLESNLRSKRKKFAKTNKDIGATIKTIPFGDDSIEFLSTPDNRYRSFYAVSGDCHLMTTSLVVARRFLEAGRGIGSLADSKEYKFARYNMPISRDDTIFVYLSTGFFQQLLTPQYQIELRRRNRILTDMMLLELAQMAASNEGNSGLDLTGLINQGYLPQGYAYRPDGGQVDLKDGVLVDSIRGRRGFFAPIPDLPLSRVTREESQWYKERATFFSGSIKSLDPMFIAIKRYEHRKNVERVVFDARLAPFGEEKYGWLVSMLGPPLKKEVATGKDDIVRLSVSMQGGRSNPNVAPHQVFAAVQDQVDPAIDLRPTSMLQMLKTLKEVPGYLGAWPSPGYTSWMPALGGAPDQWGYTYSRLLKLWKLQWGEFSLLGFDQNRLERLKPDLRLVDSDTEAQLRLKVGDLAHSKLSDWASSVSYRRSWQTSVANVRLLNLLTQQFRVRPENARSIVERMLDVELVCSLRGEYELVELPSRRKIWHSSAWPSFSSPQLPAGHTSPLLRWFRGLEIDVTKGESQFSVHGFIDIERQETKSALPSFDLFKGFGSLLGGGKKAPKKDPQNESKKNSKEKTESKK